MTARESRAQQAEPGAMGADPGVTVGWPETVIRPSEGRVMLALREVYRHCNIVSLLIWRDIKVRYKQTVVGAAWAVLQPLLTMVVLTVLFGRLIEVSTEGVPYSIFAYSALVPWTYFVHALTKATTSLVEQSGAHYEGLLPPSGDRCCRRPGRAG